jgi:hypothetical protein
VRPAVGSRLTEHRTYVRSLRRAYMRLKSDRLAVGILEQTTKIPTCSVVCSIYESEREKDEQRLVLSSSFAEVQEIRTTRRFWGLNWIFHIYSGCLASHNDRLDSMYYTPIG